MTFHAPPEPQALMLPRMSRTEARARSALAQRCLRQVVDLDGVEWTVTVCPTLDEGALCADPSDWVMRLDWGGATFDVCIPQSAAWVWVTTRFPGLDPVSLPDPWIAAAMEAASEQVLRHLEGLQQGPARMEFLARSGPEGIPFTHHLLLDCRSREQRLRLRLATGSLGLFLLAGLVSRLAQVPNSLPLETLPVRLLAQVGCTGLSLHALQSLSVGDSILLDQVFMNSDGGLFLGDEHGGFRAVCAEGSLNVLTEFAPGGWTMLEQEVQSRTEDGDPGDRLADLPLRVTFDVGERVFTLGALRGLQAGQVIELDRPLGDYVNVRVNGALVATGELVEIDGRLGVTLTALAARSPAMDDPAGVREDAPSATDPDEAEPDRHDGSTQEVTR